MSRYPDIPQNTGGQAPLSGTMEALGQSDAFLEFQERLSKVAAIDRPVLLLGERGTGKELAAGHLHYLSQRWQGPLVSLNSAALSPSLIESELFGHEAGAFTGAQHRRTGRFEAANGGTLFLDEIGSIPLEAQEKILRVVEYGSFERVGGSVSVETDVRIIAATNADLVGMADKGQFKKDLLDRLSFEILFLPPLREREGDVSLLANHFARRMTFEMNREEIPEFSPEAMSKLEAHAWKGNIRELKNVVERAAYRSDSPFIDEIETNPFRSPYPQRKVKSDKPKESVSPPSSIPDFTSLPLKSAVRALEIHMLRRALDTAKYNQKKSAASLGLTYDQFRGLRRKYLAELNS